MTRNCYNCTHCDKFMGARGCKIQKYSTIYQPTLECPKFKPTLMYLLFHIDHTPKEEKIILTDNCKKPQGWITYKID